jgi:PTS system glucose-specific IIA component
LHWFPKKSATNTIILAPQTGRVVPVTEVPDPVFSEKVMGDGIAVIPENDLVCAPVAGKIVQIAETLHLVCLVSDAGLELLIHLGLETVKLEGAGFTCFVKKGQRVAAGEQLIKMDLNFIKAKGFNPISPCVIINMDRVKKLSITPGQALAGKTVVMNGCV